MRSLQLVVLIGLFALAGCSSTASNAVGKIGGGNAVRSGVTLPF